MNLYHYGYLFPDESFLILSYLTITYPDLTSMFLALYIIIAFAPEDNDPFGGY